MMEQEPAARTSAAAGRSVPSGGPRTTAASTSTPASRPSVRPTRGRAWRSSRSSRRPGWIFGGGHLLGTQYPPAVVHWKVGHFAAIIEHQEIGGQDLYLLRDPTFGEDRWTTGAILDQEASGIVLAPAADSRTADWASVPDDEARFLDVGHQGGALPRGQQHRMNECGRPSGSRGMARRYLITHLATSPLKTPIWNNPRSAMRWSSGSPTTRQTGGGTPSWMSTLGPRWMHNWRGEIEVVASTFYWHDAPTNPVRGRQRIADDVRHHPLPHGRGRLLPRAVGGRVRDASRRDRL